MSDLPHSRGQALVEFAIALPILILLVAGVLELGRGYAAAVATSDAARDGARYAAGKAANTNGPGLAAICSLITADLKAFTANISCPARAKPSPLPFVAGVDYAVPVGGQAVFAIYCGGTLTCVGASNSVLYHYEIHVSVYYGFNDLNLFGGRITIPGSSQTMTSW
ncbi:MAG TPA: TadE/TadG family type IV pilus assembly protein [Candidatus Dormibacteraeota bacterium]|nr:TadE/TadG family type IV pilus assembly protein [Candidatus Dormibacteraeota bacterium]